MSTTDLSSLTDAKQAAPAILTPRTLGGLTLHTIETKPTTYNFLIYGEPGVGKTVFAGSADEVEGFGPVLFLDAEGGTLSLNATHPNCLVVRAKTWGDIAKFYSDLYDLKDGSIKTLVVDSLSEIGKFCMNQVMKEVIAKDPERDPDVPSVREWGICLERMRRFIRGMRDIEHVNTIMTAHIYTDKDQATGVQKNYPSLNGQLRREAAGFFDFVFYMYTLMKKDGEAKRLLMTAPNGKFIAKDRSGQLPILVEDPTMAVVMDYILGKSTN